jgi:hypothetical protein
MYQIKNASCLVVTAWESSFGVLPHSTSFAYLMMLCAKVWKACHYLLEGLPLSPLLLFVYFPRSQFLLLAMSIDASKEVD